MQSDARNEANAKEADAKEDYRYDEDAEGHENQLEFERDYTTQDKLKDTGLISKEREEAVRRALEEGKPEGKDG